MALLWCFDSSAGRSRFNPDIIMFAEAGYPPVNAVTINGIMRNAIHPRLQVRIHGRSMHHSTTGDTL